MNKTTYIYIALFLLTTLTFSLGSTESFSFLYITITLLIALIKGQLIIDYFMGLKNVKLKYRMIVSLWLVSVLSLIGIAFYIPIN